MEVFTKKLKLDIAHTKINNALTRDLKLLEIKSLTKRLKKLEDKSKKISFYPKKIQKKELTKKELKQRAKKIPILKRLFLRSCADISISNKHNFLQTKLLNVLHKYTGYYKINIYGKSLPLLEKYTLELIYNKHFSYLKFIVNNFLIEKKYNYLWKNKVGTKFTFDKVYQKRIKNFMKNFKDITPLFLEKFPFYLVKLYKPFIEKLMSLLSLKHYDIEYKYKIVKDSFMYIYESNEGHFFKAFKFYKLLLINLHKFNILNVKGIKIIIKGRFGKVRKQIQKLTVGTLKLNTLNQKVVYFSDYLVTKRGSYGFHMWFGERPQTLRKAKPTTRKSPSSLKLKKKNINQNEITK